MKNCTYVLRTVLCLCVILVAGRTIAQSPYTNEILNSSNGDKVGFLQYLPKEYSTEPSSIRHPIIIFLHGIGERGNGTTELQKVGWVGMPRIINAGNKMRFTWNGKTETFLVIAPQCPLKYGMWPQLFVDELIEYARKDLRIDTNRIYLTGLSMGAGGSMKYITNGAANYPYKIAACATIAPPCVFGTGKNVAAANLPVWAWHAQDDPIVPASCTRNMVNGINSWNPVVKPLMDIWPDGGHTAWDRVYCDTNYKYQGVVNIYEWFLGQNKSLAPNVLPKAKSFDVTTSIGTGTATLDASASADADGYLVRYVWKKLSGPAAGVITTKMGAAASTTITGLTTAGTYKFAVFAVDNRAAFTSDTITLTVTSGGPQLPPANVLPVAKAGNDITITLPANSTVLNGSSSTDPDGSISAYNWKKISGPSSFSLTNAATSGATASGLVQGSYQFKLMVTDNKGGTHADTVVVKVNAAPLPPNVLPVAKAGNDITITLPSNSTTLNGNGSTDSDGTINAYSWAIISGPAQFIFANPNAPSTQVSNLKEGTYLFRLVVTDNRGGTDADTIAVVVNAAPPPPNTDPSADAGSDKTIALPLSTISLDGNNSDDADGTIITYSWTKISGPAAFNITNPALPVTTITGLIEGTYSFKLAVTDDKGGTNADTVTVLVNAAAVPPPVPNIAPIAKAGNNISITLPLDNAGVNGSSSFDTDGTIINYLWTKISGPAQFTILSPKSSVTTISNMVEGVYAFRLQVKDDDGATSRDTIIITVNPAPNDGPLADAGHDFEVQLPNPVIRLNGLGSADTDGSIVSYNWTKVSGPAGLTITNSTTATPGVVGVKAGAYIFRLAVTDNSGAIRYDDVKVTVVAAEEAPLPEEPYNYAPVANAGEDQRIALPVSSARIDGQGSYDTEGAIFNYSWKQVSGPSSAAMDNRLNISTAISGLATGDYIFALTVTDIHGFTSTDSVTISVTSNLRFEQQIGVYPNPAKSGITIQMTSDTTGPMRVSIYNVSGAVVKTFTAIKQQSELRHNLDISKLQAGLYYIDVVIGHKQRMISKFVKQ